MCLLFCLQIKFFVAKWGRSNTLFYRPQPPTKAPIQNINAQPEKTFTEATAENTEQHADAPADTCHNEDKASADADVKNPPAEISAAEGTVRESSESKSTAGVSGESVIKTEPPNTINLEHAGVNMYGPPALATSGKEASLQGGVETPAVSDEVMQHQKKKLLYNTAPYQSPTLCLHHLVNPMLTLPRVWSLKSSVHHPLSRFLKAELKRRLSAKMKALLLNKVLIQHLRQQQTVTKS